MVDSWMDGMHRVCKALMEGNKTICAVQFKHDPEPDYQNIQHSDDLRYEEKMLNNCIQLTVKKRHFFFAKVKNAPFLRQLMQALDLNKCIHQATM